MEFRLLGPVEIFRDGKQVVLPSPRSRAVLAALLLRANEVVTATELVEAVWAAAPVSADSNLRTYLSRLRGILSDRLHRRSSGYIIEVGPDELDVLEFRREAASGAAAWDHGQPASAVTMLMKAIGCWRGPAMVSVPLDGLLLAEASGLEAQKRQVRFLLAQAQLVVGRHMEALPDLRRLVEEEPLWEVPWAMLMFALYSTGQRAEALDTYRRLYRILTQQVGIEPAREVQSLHQRILAQDSTLESRQLFLAAASHDPD